MIDSIGRLDFRPFSQLESTPPSNDRLDRFRGLHWTSNVKGQIERKFVKFWTFRGLEIRGYKKKRFLLQTAHPCVNTRRLSHFARRSVGSLTPRADIEKVRKSRERRGSREMNDVSLLTQLDTVQLVWLMTNTNRKLHMRFQLTRRLVTLDDTELL